MQKNINFIIILLFGVTAFSCVATKTLVIDIPLPSPKELPASIQSLTIVSQAVDERFNDIPSDSLQKIFYKKRFDVDTVIYDRHMADTTMIALGELLFESGRYDFVIPEDRFLGSQNDSVSATELSWKEAELICKTYNTDAVLSLDDLKTRIITQYDKETFYDPSMNGFYSSATAKMQICYEALFRVYDPSNKQIVLYEFIRDTLFWKDTDISTSALFNRFTPVKQALTETGIAIALELNDKIAVRWRPERRKYFTKGNSNLRQASKLINEGDWKTAIDLWMETAENAGSRSLKSKAELNIAVGYEILGDIDLAISWALRSYHTQYRPLTYEYLEILKRRKRELVNY